MTLDPKTHRQPSYAEEYPNRLTHVLVDDEEDTDPDTEGCFHDTGKTAVSTTDCYCSCRHSVNQKESLFG